MVGLASEVDVAVIGAGAAGIAAGRRLVAAGRRRSVLVLEARDRVGGRDLDGRRRRLSRCDLGGEWLHSADRNVLSPLAEAARLLGLPPAAGMDHAGCATAAARPKRRQDWIAAREAHYWAIHRAAQEPEDRPAATVLTPGGRWNTLFDATSTWANAVELEKLSVKDNDRYEDSGVNWRRARGLRHAARHARRRACRSPSAPRRTRIDHRGRAFASKPPAARSSAARVVVAVPTAADRRRGRCASTRSCPDKMTAAAGLPLGLANKLFFRFDGRPAGDRRGDISWSGRRRGARR